KAIQLYETKIIETLPHTYIAKYKLPTLNEAIIWMHFPASELHLKQARRRFVYEELLLFQIKMQLLRKISRESEYGDGIKIDEKVINEFIQTCPYELTNAHNRSLKELFKDLNSPYRVNQLLHGPLGAARTVTARL